MSDVLRSSWSVATLKNRELCRLESYNMVFSQILTVSSKGTFRDVTLSVRAMV